MHIISHFVKVDIQFSLLTSSEMFSGPEIMLLKLGHKKYCHYNFGSEFDLFIPLFLLAQGLLFHIKAYGVYDQYVFV